jgi:arginine decarboxylase
MSYMPQNFPASGVAMADHNQGLLVPKRFFLGAGSGDSKYPLCAFDRALLAAGVGNTNLVRLSSILPPHCRRIDPVPLPQGALVPIAYAGLTDSTPGTTIAAAVAIAFPEDENHCALIMEYSSKGRLAEVEEQVRDMARENMLFRGQKIREILSVGAEHTVAQHGSAFACVVSLP